MSGTPQRDHATPVAHVLVVHSILEVRDGIGGILTRAGYHVAEAGSVDEALGALDTGAVDVLVASLRLPPGGLVSLLKMRRRLPPIVVLDGPAIASVAPVWNDLATVRDDPRVVSVLTVRYELQELYDALVAATRRPSAKS